jgi:hypothetical protein
MLSTTYGFDKHLAADENKETERNPVAEALDKVSEHEAPEPAQHGHEHLKPTKPPAWPQRIAQSHSLYPAPVRHGHGECVHRKPHCYDENSPETHTTSTIDVATQTGNTRNNDDHRWTGTTHRAEKYTGKSLLYKPEH